MTSGETGHDVMVMYREMFQSARSHPSYGFGQYAYSNTQYNDVQPDVVPDMTYPQQNIVSWPYSTSSRSYNDWVQQQQQQQHHHQQQQTQNISSTNGTAIQNQNYACLPTSYHHHPHMQRHPQDVHHCSSNGLVMPQDPVSSGSGPDGQTSPNSAVAVSSDGLSGSESPGCPLHNQGSLTRPQQARSPFEWMKKASYQSQPNPGKTRTKDKYRVVYTDHQRLELEKEFHYCRYITIRRKTELAAMLGLSERQVKIWFQNRRAKDRKQAKKRDEMLQKSNKDSLMQSNHATITALNLFKPILHFEQDNHM